MWDACVKDTNTNKYTMYKTCMQMQTLDKQRDIIAKLSFDCY